MITGTSENPRTLRITSVPSMSGSPRRRPLLPPSRPSRPRSRAPRGSSGGLAGSAARHRPPAPSQHRLLEREVDHHRGPASRRLLDPDAPAVGRDDGTRDREAEAAPGRLRALAPPVEGFEHLLTLLGLD